MSQQDCDQESLSKILCGTTSSIACFEAWIDASKSLLCSPSHVRTQFDMIGRPGLIPMCSASGLRQQMQNKTPLLFYSWYRRGLQGLFLVVRI